MRIALLIAGSTLALAIAAPAFAQTGALNGAAGTAPNLPNVPAVKSLPATPVAKPRIGHSNRPSVKVRAPVSQASKASGQTLAQLKAPRHPGDSRMLRARSTSTRGLTGKGASSALKRNGLQAVALGHGQGVNTKKAGLPLTAANSLGSAGHGTLTSASNTMGAGKALGSGANGHGNLGANLGHTPSLVTNPGGRKH
jgi:hypothetical protein